MEKSVYFIFVLATVCGSDDVESLLRCKHIELSDRLTNCRKSNIQVDILKTSSAASRSTGFVDYEQLFVSITQATCSQLDEYTTQLTCKHNVIDECLADEYKNLLPDQYNLAEAVRYLCTNLFDLNDQCLRDYMLNMGECLLRRGFDNPAQIADSSVKENTCKLYSYASTCVATTFRQCGVTPLKIYRKAMTYLAPRACSGAVKVTAVMLTLAITTSVCGSDDVESLLRCKHIELSDRLTNCRKGNIQVGILKTSSAASRSTGFVDYEQLFVSATQATCSQLDEYTTQLTCKHNVIDECLADEYKNLLPDQYNLAEAVRYLCTNLFDLNDQCLRDYMLNMGECLLRRGFDNPAQIADSSVKENTCKLYSYASTCVATTFRQCGVTPLKIYRKAMTYLAPRACSGAVKVTAVMLTLAITTCKTLFEMLL